MWIEYRRKKQEDKYSEDDIGKRVKVAVVKHQYDKSQTDARAYPNDLHARARGERENFGVAVSIARTTDAYPSEGEQGKVYANRPPVERREDTFLIVRLFHSHDNLSIPSCFPCRFPCATAYGLCHRRAVVPRSVALSRS